MFRSCDNLIFYQVLKLTVQAAERERRGIEAVTLKEMGGYADRPVLELIKVMRTLFALGGIIPSYTAMLHMDGHECLSNCI